MLQLPCYIWESLFVLVITASSSNNHSDLSSKMISESWEKGCDTDVLFMNEHFTATYSLSFGYLSINGHPEHKIFLDEV